MRIGVADFSLRLEFVGTVSTVQSGTFVGRVIAAATLS